MITIEMILKKWRSNEFIPVLLKSMTHVLTIIDGKLLNRHCIICGNVIANEVIKLSKVKWH